MHEGNLHSPRKAAGLAAACLLALAACQPEEGSARRSATPGPQAAAIPAAWHGRWQGVEGTYLEIAATDGQYQVTIADLDGPRTFPAVAAEGGLSFQRDGARELLLPTDGVATGMKWLAEKQACLTVRAGEGYCRE